MLFLRTSGEGSNDPVAIHEQLSSTGAILYRWECPCGSSGLSNASRVGALRGFAWHVARSFRHRSGARPGAGGAHIAPGGAVTPLTADQLTQIMPRVAEPGVWAEVLNASMAEFTVNSAARMAAFLAQVAHES